MGAGLSRSSHGLLPDEISTHSRNELPYVTRTPFPGEVRVFGFRLQPPDEKICILPPHSRFERNLSELVSKRLLELFLFHHILLCLTQRPIVIPLLALAARHPQQQFQQR